MHKKFLSVLAVATMTLGAVTLTSCQTNPTSTTPVQSTPGPSSTTPPVSTTTPPSSVTPPSSSVKIINVASVELTASKTTLEIGEELQLSVAVLPENATDKTVSYSSSVPTVATVSAEGIVKALVAGKTVITVTSTDGNKTDTVEITVNPAVAAPVITITGETTNLQVAAGADLTLPDFTAVDYLGASIKSDVEVSDYNDGNSVNPNTMVFNSKISGVHVISYYVEKTYGNETLSDEKTVNITVTPGNTNNFDTTGHENPSIIRDYGTFKDGFEDGINSELYKALGDSNNSSTISSLASEAIEGNSLIVDFNKTAGNATYSLFLNAFNEHFLKGQPVTYTIEFDYKLLDEGVNYGDCYAGLSWDGSSGINNNFVKSGSTVGQVNHASFKFSETTIPTAGNAYFFFFKLGVQKTARIALDNFVVSAQECAQTTIVVPTASQLMAEGGFTWDWKDSATTITKGETVIVNNIEDETIKTAIKDDTENFGENVMHLTGRDDHVVAGLNADNMIAGKKITLKVRYYSVNDNRLNMLVTRASGGADTVNTNLVKTDIGNGIKELTWNTTLVAGQVGLNFYPQDANFNIYLGRMTIALVDADPVPEDQTPGGYVVGDTVTVAKRGFDGGNKVSDTINATYHATKPEGAAAELPAQVTHAKWTHEGLIEWYRNAPLSGKDVKFLEPGQVYTAKLVYEIVSIEEGKKACLVFDQSQFIDLDSSVGYHSFEIDITPSAAPEFINWYTNANNCEMYLASMTFTLKTINK